MTDSMKFCAVCHSNPCICAGYEAMKTNEQRHPLSREWRKFKGGCEWLHALMRIRQGGEQGIADALWVAFVAGYQADASPVEPKLNNIEFLQTWMRTPNPQFGNIAQLEMLKMGRGEKMAKFIEAAHFLDQPPDEPRDELVTRFKCVSPSCGRSFKLTHDAGTKVIGAECVCGTYSPAVRT